MEAEPRAQHVSHPDWMARTPGELPWADVDARLREARNYWVGTVRADGRPHSRPVWGVWFDGVLAPTAGGGYWMLRNLRARPRVTVHLEAAEGLVVVLDGVARPVAEPDRLARGVDLYNAKYDMTFAAEDWGREGGLEIAPERVYAWVTTDGPNYRATRFTWD
jgi:hypothetical protein